MRRKNTGRPVAGVNDEAWRADALCRSDVTVVSPEDWFLPNEASALRAKAICGRCPVQQACLAYALRTQQSWGVWGGQTSAERGTAY